MPRFHCLHFCSVLSPISTTLYFFLLLVSILNAVIAGTTAAQYSGLDAAQIQFIRNTTVDVVQRPRWNDHDNNTHLVPGIHADERARLLQSLSRDKGNWDNKHPRWKLLEALHAFDRYQEIAGAEINRFEGLYKHVPRRHKKILEKSIQYDKNFAEARRLIDVNARVCQDIVQHAFSFYDVDRLELDEFLTTTSKPEKDQRGLRTSVSQALKHLVRDWSSEGIAERNATFPYIFQHLNTYLPPPDNLTAGGQYKVLVPGAGLGRLAHDISALGPHMQVTTNEYSNFMNMAYRWSAHVLSDTQSAHSQTIHPFIETWSHAKDRHEIFRPVFIADREALISHQTTAGSTNQPLLMEGDFTQIFANANHTGQYDAIVTFFFIDTARNLVSYLETIYELLKPGGVWINVGPLLYGSAPWVQLSLDELVAVAEAMGFVFEEGTRDEREVLYNFNQSSLYKNAYSAQYWVARKEVMVKADGKGWW